LQLFLVDLPTHRFIALTSLQLQVCCNAPSCFGDDDPVAGVLGRQLGLPLPGRLVDAAAFGPGAGPVLLDQIKCDASAQGLNDCQFSLNTAACGHAQDVGLVCSAPPSKWVQPACCCSIAVCKWPAGSAVAVHALAGAVESRCQHNQLSSDAATRCTFPTLPCSPAAPCGRHGTEVGPPGTAGGWAAVGIGEWLAKLCSESEATTCVLCVGHAAFRLESESWARRLPGILPGSNTHARTQICNLRGANLTFTDRSASVACRQMGLKLPGRVVRAGAFGTSTGPVFASSFDCSGREARLEACLHGFWGRADGCTPLDDVGIECGYSPPAGEPYSCRIWVGSG